MAGAKSRRWVFPIPVILQGHDIAVVHGRKQVEIASARASMT